MDLHRLFFLLSLTVMWYTCLRWPFHSITYSQLTHSLVWQRKQKAELSHPSREWARELGKEPERERGRKEECVSCRSSQPWRLEGEALKRFICDLAHLTRFIRGWSYAFDEYIFQNQWESTVERNESHINCLLSGAPFGKNPICAFCIWLTGGTHGRFICRQLLAVLNDK